MRAARFAFAGYFFLLAAVAGFSGVVQMFEDSDEHSHAVWVLLGVDWLLSGLLFAAAGALLLTRRTDLPRRATVILAGVCTLDAVLLTFAPVFGAPIGALASLAAVVRWGADQRVRRNTD
jgi:hypothetical protein